MSEGLKYDGGKLRWDLVPFECLEGVVKVLTFGAEKYKANSWQGVEPYRYKAALCRHVSSYMQGEEIDPESGLPHMAHIMCNALFLEYFDQHGEYSGNDEATSANTR